jgi:hypothetical protein
MSIMAVHLTMTRSGRWPERIGAGAWGINNTALMALDILVRPREGEMTTSVSQAVAERSGLELHDVRCALRLIGGRSADEWTGMVKVSTLLICHDLDATSARMASVRETFGMSPVWRRPAMRVADTQEAARILLGRDGTIPLDEAAREITGKPLTGVEALVAIYNTPEAARVWRAA